MHNIVKPFYFWLFENVSRVSLRSPWCLEIFLLADTAAMRNTKKGSWFIQELNTALRLHSKDKHLADILVQVRFTSSSWHVQHLFRCTDPKMLIFPSALSLPLSCDCRSMLASRRGKAFLLAPPTTAARKCQSLPAHCAKTSSSSPSTKFLSINMTQCIFWTLNRTYWEIHLTKSKSRHLMQNTEHISPLTYVCIQTVSVVFISWYLKFNSSAPLEW